MEKIHNEFVTVSELAVGFSEYRLEQSQALAGQNWELFCENGHHYAFNFVDHECVKVTITWEEESFWFATLYDVVAITESIYLMDVIVAGHLLAGGKEQSLTAVVDVQSARATLVLGELPTPADYGIGTFYRAARNMPITAVQVTVMAATLNAPWNNNRHEVTHDLIGQQLRFRYSHNDLYQHTYLNENYYTWECLEGIEKGLCDTDRCLYYRIDEDIYLFIWFEKIIPTLGIVVESLQAQRSHGKIYGYAGYESGKTQNFIVGSHIET